MADQGILHGLRVIDLSRMLSGPYCTMMLADHGAEVIKIEDAHGDTSRTNGPFRDDDPNRDWAGYFVSLNRSKKSIVLDLKSEAGKATMRSLVSTADVLVENFRPGVMERLGLSYENLSQINPRLIYAAIRGFGDPRSGTSPYAEWPSYDVVAQAMGGLISLTGPDAATPTKVGPGIGDVFAGMVMAFGIMAALRQAEATGKGQFIDVGMYDSMVSLCERMIYQHDFDGTVPGPEGNGHPLLAPFGVFPAQDGQVAIGIVDDAFWRALAQAMGRGDLAHDHRFATRAARLVNAGEVTHLVSVWSATRSKAELTRILGGGIPFGPVNTVADIFADPHIAARKMIATIPHPEGHRPWKVAANPLHFSTHPTPELKAPARLGADADLLLATAALSAIDPRALRDAFGTFATGVTVLTTLMPDGTPRGFTANSLTSVSLDPPLLLVCLAKSAHSAETFMDAPQFAVNVLAEDQKAISGLFASRAPDKFQQCQWYPGQGGTPLLDGALAQFTCVRTKLVDAGDHIVMIGRVVDFATTEAAPLGYFRGKYFSVGLEDPLVEAAAKSGAIRVGAVLNQNGLILLNSQADGSLILPRIQGPTASRETLQALLQSQGLHPQLDFLYAVFEDREAARHAIYYHGDVGGAVPAAMTLVALDDLAKAKLADPSERFMLDRYAQDYRFGTFSIYTGTKTTGTVRRIQGA